MKATPKMLQGVIRLSSWISSFADSKQTYHHRGVLLIGNKFQLFRHIISLIPYKFLATDL